jgi:hypothetical protein
MVFAHFISVQLHNQLQSFRSAFYGTTNMHAKRIFLPLFVGIVVPLTQSLLVEPVPHIRRKTSATSFPLLAAGRRRRRTNEALYYDYEEEEDNDNTYYDTSPSFRQVGDSEAERQLRNMPLASPEDEEDTEDFIYCDDEDDEAEKLTFRRPIVGAWEDEEEDDDDVATIGNFWTNPVETVDVTVPSSRRGTTGAAATPRRPPRRRPQVSSITNRKRTTFRSGTPPPPPPVTDFYNRLFWYGFDPNDAQDSPADRTMFGGTKGKFNGLAYLNSDEADKASWRRERQARALPYMEDNDYVDGDYEVEEYYDDDDNDIDAILPGPTSRRREDRRNKRVSSPSPLPSIGKPPWDSPRPRRGELRRRQRRSQRNRGVDINNNAYSDVDEYAERKTDIASWFDVQAEVDVNDDGYDDEDDRRTQRQRRRSGTTNDAWNPLDIFLGKNRQTLSRQADAYRRSMGLDDMDDVLVDGRQRRRRNTQQESPPLRRRDGFAYPYSADETDDEDEPIVVDLETVVERDNSNDSFAETKNYGQQENPQEEDINSESDSPKRPPMTWEERSLAMERVPPANVPAWGPSGALGIDARTHAIAEAVQDIVEAERKIEARQAKVEKLREELSILKVDVELERQKLLKQQKQRRDRTASQSAALRELELDVEDAARSLRSAQLQLRSAQDDLAETERRHWGLISFYDPDSATMGVEEAFRELAETEPAVQRVKEKMKQQRDKTATPTSSPEEAAEEDTSPSIKSENSV